MVALIVRNRKVSKVSKVRLKCELYHKVQQEVIAEQRFVLAFSNQGKPGVRVQDGDHHSYEPKISQYVFINAGCIVPYAYPLLRWLQ